MKKKIFAAFTVALAVFTLGCTSETKANEGNYYPETFVVTNIHEPHSFFNSTDEYKLELTNANGQTFSLYAEDGDVLPFDIYSAIMYDNGTPLVYDDEIKQIQYSGRLEMFEYICDDWHGNGDIGYTTESNGTYIMVSAER